MEHTLLNNVYSPEEFRRNGHQLIDQLADHLNKTIHKNSPKVINWNLPEDEKAHWVTFLKEGKVAAFFPEILRHTTHVHHPKYIGHQVGAPAPIASLAALLSAMLNNGMAVYEMGMAPSAIERIITDFLCEKTGYNKNARGILTSGGTLANLTALLAARKAIVEHDVWNKGHKNRLGIMVSEEAHYCVDRAAKIMGLGEEGIIKIPVTKDYSIDTSLLQANYDRAEKAGIKVFAVVGSAPSTATGVYDDLEYLGRFSEKNGLWFHVDGAHGGAAIFSEKYRHTVQGIQMADSVVIDGHKMMMMPTITTALLFKNGDHSHATFSQKADYLLQQSEDEDWYNLAKRTFECTKNMMSIQWFIVLKTYGEKVFEENVTTLYDLGQQFAESIQKDPQLELAVTPMSNIVCFRFVLPHCSQENLNAINLQIRQQLLEKGDYYIVQTKIRDVQYLRTTIMNPFTSLDDLQGLIDLVKEKGNSLIPA